MTGWVKAAVEKAHLLNGFLSFLVGVAIEDLKRKGGPTEADWESAREVGVKLSHTGDAYDFRCDTTAKERQERVTTGQIAKALAVGAWCPGGFDLGGVHFEEVQDAR